MGGLSMGASSECGAAQSAGLLIVPSDKAAWNRDGFGLCMVAASPPRTFGADQEATESQRRP